MWIAPFELRAILAVECAACPFKPAAVAVQDESVTAGRAPTGIASLMNVIVRGGETLPLPTLPRGWRLVDGQAICPLHAIKIEPKTEDRPSGNDVSVLVRRGRGGRARA